MFIKSRLMVGIAVFVAVVSGACGQAPMPPTATPQPPPASVAVAREQAPTQIPTPRTISTPTPMRTPRPTPAAVSMPTPPPASTPKPTAMPLLPLAETPELTGPPTERNIEHKRHMLDLINEVRADNGAGPVVLGDNIAAQLHAEAALSGCFLSHWGADGLKPDMRYGLAGGYQYARENVYGHSHCIRSGDGFRAISGNIPRQVSKSVTSLMSSPGHRDNILDPKHRKVNIGITWDDYNISVVQQFEGDYVEYARLPEIADGVVLLSGSVKNGATFEDPERRDGLSVAIYYDPPPRSLNRGHLASTSCVRGGVKIASLRRPPPPNSNYPSDEYLHKSTSPCPDPYDLPSDLPEPNTSEEAKGLKTSARSASPEPVEVTVQWVTASVWDAGADSFTVEANIGLVLDQYGPGVYTVVVWANLDDDSETVSEYVIFYEITPPDGYDQ